MNPAFQGYLPLAVAPAAPQTAVAEVPSSPAPAEPPRGEMDVSGRMVILTWISFLLAAYLLYKLAWKPILAALEKREEMIRKSLQDVEFAKRQVEMLQAKQKQIIADADRQAREILDQGRQAAQTLAAQAETRAREEARETVAAAAREIQEARERAVRDLRRESADLAIALAEKLVRRNLDSESQRELMRKLTDEV